MVLATLGIALSTAYVARFARLLLQGEPTLQDADADLGWLQRVIVLLLLVPVVALGVLPALVLGLFPTMGYVP
jgi:NADH-quinone oxidoreductase subunit M